MPNIFGISENWHRWLKMVAVKLPDMIENGGSQIMSGSITFKNILSVRVLKWLIILVGHKIKGNEL